MENTSFETENFVSLIRSLNTKGHNPCTSGNYSFRTQDGFAISVSGVDKEFFTAKDFLFMDQNANPIESDESRKPSDETQIHRALYAMSDARIVLHSHHLAFAWLSDMIHEDFFALSGLEMIKAFVGKKSHQDTALMRVYGNTQNISDLSKQIEKDWKKETQGLLLKHHGLYVWGQSMSEAKRHLEAWLYLAEYYVGRRK